MESCGSRDLVAPQPRPKQRFGLARQDDRDVVAALVEIALFNQREQGAGIGRTIVWCQPRAETIHKGLEGALKTGLVSWGARCSHDLGQEMDDEFAMMFV